MVKAKNVKEVCPYLEAKCDSEPECPCAKYKAYEKMNEPGIIESKLESLGCSLDMDSWKLLMTMQKQFAAKFHKVDNLEKTEKDYWVNAYLVCIEDECREIREHLDPNKILGMDELKKEIIDVLHFVMDAFIVGGMDAETLKKYYLKEYAPNVIDVKDFLQFAYDTQYSYIYSMSDFENDMDGITSFKNIMLQYSCKILDTNGEVRQQISWKHWKKPSATINEEKLYIAFTHMFKSLIDAFCAVDMSADQIKNIYVKKNVENILRQEYNY